MRPGAPCCSTIVRASSAWPTVRADTVMSAQIKGTSYQGSACWRARISMCDRPMPPMIVPSALCMALASRPPIRACPRILGSRSPLEDGRDPKIIGFSGSGSSKGHNHLIAHAPLSLARRLLAGSMSASGKRSRMMRLGVLECGQDERQGLRSLPGGTFGYAFGPSGGTSSDGISTSRTGCWLSLLNSGFPRRWAI